MRNHVITLNVKIEELKKGNQRLQRENEALNKVQKKKVCSKGEIYVQKEKEMFKKKLCPGKLGG